MKYALPLQANLRREQFIWKLMFIYVERLLYEESCVAAITKGRKTFLDICHQLSVQRGKWCIREERTLYIRVNNFEIYVNFHYWLWYTQWQNYIHMYLLTERDENYSCCTVNSLGYVMLESLRCVAVWCACFFHWYSADLLSCWLEYIQAQGLCY